MEDFKTSAFMLMQLILNSLQNKLYVFLYFLNGKDSSWEF